MYAGSYQLAWILALLIVVAVFSGWNGWKGDPVSNSTVIGGKETLIEGRLKLYVLLLWLTFPILLPYIVSQFSSPIFLPKYTIAALPAFTILAARGLLSLPFHQLRMVVLLLLLCFSFFPLRNYFGSYKKDLWREAVASFQSLARPHDLVLFNDQSGRFPFQYYSRRSDLDEKPFPDFQVALTAENLSNALLRAVQDHERVWLVISHPNMLTPLLPQQLAEWYEHSTRITYPGVEMYLFEKRK
jgi:hypothetical protein